MNKLLYLIALASASFVIPVVNTGCSTPKNERVAVVQTLKAAGQSAEAAVELSARLYANGHISAEKARDVIDFYNNKFQPAYRFAVTAAQGDLNSLSSPEVWNLLQQLTNLVASYQTK